ncbi:MAG TPA: DMT family transporter [Acidimicrobiales bacterium]|nr:DMT family transporter [Acidimicrobiales bacterium]
MALVLALVAAMSWGASDFVAGRAERVSPGLSVAVASQFAGLLAAIALLPLVEGDRGGAALWAGAAGGIGSAIGLALLYHALAVGRMSVTAPITGAVAAAIPVLYGLVTGERPAVLALVGVVVALGAIVVLSATPPASARDLPAEGPLPPESEASRRQGLLSQPGVAAALMSGVGFGAFFIFLGRTGDGAGLWPIFAAKLSAVALLGSVALATGRTVKPAPSARSSVAVVGLLDMAANVLFLLATRRGLLSLVALVTSLYPAVTVLLARAVLKERLTRVQVLSVATAGGGVALIALG